MLNFAHKYFGSLAHATLLATALIGGFVAALLLVLTLSRAQPAIAETHQPPLPNDVEATITITLAAANTPTQTTILTVSNPTSNTAAIGVNFYKGSVANNQLACTLGPDILAAGSTSIYTVTETPGCASQTFSGDAVVSANQAVTATATIQRITLHYVAPNADCGSVGQCYASPQAAADVAATGDTIKIAEGVYTSQAFQVLYLNRGVTILGGYTKTNWSQAYPITQPTVLDGQNILGQRVVQVVDTGTGTLTLDGLVVRNGNLRNESQLVEGAGAGINILSGTVIIRNSQIVSNTGVTGSGVNSLRSLTISGTQFVGNEASSGSLGAAVRVENGPLVINNSGFSSNRFITGTRIVPSNRGAIDAKDTAVTIISTTIENTLGGGIFVENGSLNISNSQIRNNASIGISLLKADAQVISNVIEFNGNAATEGGGVSFDSLCLGTLAMSNNVIRNNVALQGGGLGGRVGPLTLVNNLFQNNTALSAGGALHLQQDSLNSCTTPPSANLQNNRFLGNRADKAGAIYVDGGYRAQTTNDVIANNVTSGFQTAALHVAVGRLDVRHATIVGNGRYAISTGSGSAALTNTIIAGHSVAGLAGNVNSQYSLFFGNGGTCSSGATCANDRTGDPRFLWPLVDDYHICLNSAAIDQGINAGVTTDFEAEKRPQGSGVDIGADEWNESPCKKVRGIFLPFVIKQS